MGYLRAGSRKIGGKTDMEMGKSGWQGGKARTMEEFGQMMARAHEGERPNHRAYAPAAEGQPRDVFVTCWAKSGTTLMQQMFHQLRTGSGSGAGAGSGSGSGSGAGDMDFDDISRVVPWDDTAFMLDFDMTAPQLASPRGFKSHREYERLPADMRYVVTLRDPKESYVSFYRFLNGWHFEPGALTLEAFMPMWLSGGPGGCDYFTHLNSWYARRSEADSLVMTYRWVVKHRAEAIRRLAALCEIELSQEIEALVLERTTREFMSAHEHRFDDAMVCGVLDERCGVPAASDSTKVQKTGSSAAALPAGIAEEIDAMWTARALPATGHADFAALAAEVDGLWQR
jgi:hypothetical protein